MTGIEVGLLSIVAILVLIYAGMYVPVALGLVSFVAVWYLRDAQPAIDATDTTDGACCGGATQWIDRDQADEAVAALIAEAALLTADARLATLSSNPFANQTVDVNGLDQFERGLAGRLAALLEALVPFAALLVGHDRRRPRLDAGSEAHHVGVVGDHQPVQGRPSFTGRPVDATISSPRASL